MGFTAWDLSARCHPSYAASTFYRFGTLTLWIHEPLQAHSTAIVSMRRPLDVKESNVALSHLSLLPLRVPPFVGIPGEELRRGSRLPFALDEELRTELGAG